MNYRSFIAVVIALAGCFIFFVSPVRADVSSHVYAVHNDYVITSQTFVIHDVSMPETAFLMRQDPISILSGLHGHGHPFDLKPVYLASYETAGASIDLRRRC